MLKDMKSGLSDVAATLNTNLKNSLSILSDVKEAGWEKVTTLVNEILGLEPLIEATGFSLKEFSVDATVPPSITQVFFKEKDVDDETVEKILEENKDKELLVLIVQALQKADDLQKRMKLADYRFYAMSLKIGLPPVIGLRFMRKE